MVADGEEDDGGGSANNQINAMVAMDPPCDAIGSASSVSVKVSNLRKGAPAIHFSFSTSQLLPPLASPALQPPLDKTNKKTKRIKAPGCTISVAHP